MKDGKVSEEIAAFFAARDNSPEVRHGDELFQRLCAANVRIAELEAALQSYAQTLLLARMNEYSERCYCAGWMTGTEAALWEIACGVGAPQWGTCILTDADGEELYHLAEHAKGWWIWDDNDGRCFVSLPEWGRIYRSKWGGEEMGEG